MNGTFCGPCTNSALANSPGLVADHQINWITVLEREVPFTCPACGPVYFAAKIVEKSPLAPPMLRDIAAGVCLGLLAFTAGHMVGELVDWLAEA